MSAGKVFRTVITYIHFGKISVFVSIGNTSGQTLVFVRKRGVLVARLGLVVYLMIIKEQSSDAVLFVKQAAVVQ